MKVELKDRKRVLHMKQKKNKLTNIASKTLSARMWIKSEQRVCKMQSQ